MCVAIIHQGDVKKCLTCSASGGGKRFWSAGRCWATILGPTAGFGNKGGTTFNGFPSSSSSAFLFREVAFWYRSLIRLLAKADIRWACFTGRFSRSHILKLSSRLTLVAILWYDLLISSLCPDQEHTTQGWVFEGRVIAISLRWRLISDVRSLTCTWGLEYRMLEERCVGLVWWSSFVASKQWEFLHWWKEKNDQAWVIDWIFKKGTVYTSCNICTDCWSSAWLLGSRPAASGCGSWGKVGKAGIGPFLGPQAAEVASGRGSNAGADWGGWGGCSHEKNGLLAGARLCQ